MPELEVWTALRTVPPPSMPMMLGRLEVQSNKPIPAGVALFTSEAKAKEAMEHTLAGLAPGNAAFSMFHIVRIGSPNGIDPRWYLGTVSAAFVSGAMAAGLEASKVTMMMGAVLGAYIDPTIEDAGKPPTHRSVFRLFESWFPLEVKLIKPTSTKFYTYNGYTSLIEQVNDSWLAYAKKGIFDNVDKFKQHTAKLGDAFYGVFKTAVLAEEEAKLWIDGTQMLAQV